MVFKSLLKYEIMQTAAARGSLCAIKWEVRHTIQAEVK